MRFDREMNSIYKRNAEAAGRTFPELGPGMQKVTGSTDMGNVSHAIPSIHPMIGINSLPAVNHQPEFTAHCITEEADRAVREGALAMAWTAIEMGENASLREHR
jgi:metal-dependent amidase/aminoacylase/carboxypeptidase family protein